MGHFDPRGHPEFSQSPKGEGGRTGRPGKPGPPFPRIPVRQTLVRQLVKNSNTTSSLGTGGKISSRLPRAKCSCDLRKVLPHTLLLKTNQRVGTPICEGYRLLYNRNLASRPRWMRELLYSPSSIPQSCLGVLYDYCRRRGIITADELVHPRERAQRVLPSGPLTRSRPD